MGNVKDRYFKYAENGDQFVGRCLALLPLLHIDFASSPPFFAEHTDFEWVNSMVPLQFYALKGILPFGRMLRMCLSSLLYHHRWIADHLSFNHVVMTSSICFRDAVDLKKVKDQDWIRIQYPWTDRKISFSGIPPHITLLEHIAEVRSEQKSFCLNFVNKIKEALTEYGVNAGTISEDRVATILNEFYGKFETQLSR
jgi:hypothetical protein